MSNPIAELGLLKSGHQVMTKDDCHDFRAPDLAWTNGGNAFDELVFNTVVSEFWVGPLDDVREFARQLAEQYAQWVQTVEYRGGNKVPSTNEVAVAYWENLELNLGMAAVIPYSDLYAWFSEDERAQQVPALKEGAFPSLWMLGFGGNDNGTAELAGALGDLVDDEDIDKEEAKRIAKFLFSITDENWQDELVEELNERVPCWKKKEKSIKHGP